MTSPELTHFSVGEMDNNVYILVDPETRDSVLFDAPTNSEAILEALDGTNLRAILMTHTDGDHTQALKAVKEATGAPVGVHASEAEYLPVPADFTISDGEELQYGSIRLRAMHVPGHTPGGLGFYTDGILIAGDTLFPGGPGNTRREIGDFPTIIDSIRTKFFVLPDETAVYPGHGSGTTIGAEKPHLQEWIDRGW